MSVGIFRYEGVRERDRLNSNYKLIFGKNVSSEAFYTRCWSKAVEETGSRLFRDGSEFEVSDLEKVMSELKLQLSWAEVNLSGYDLEYMKERIENLLISIPQACEESDVKFEIF